MSLHGTCGDLDMCDGCGQSFDLQGYCEGCSNCRECCICPDPADGPTEQQISDMMNVSPPERFAFTDKDNPDRGLR